MIDILSHSVTITCPNCSFEIEVLLKQVKSEESIICPGCSKDIQLVDEGGSVSRAQTEINEALEGFGRQLSRIR
jgi:endogenous inhibitor of DNA gyrase (YacG/DUF329 family)